MVEIALIVSIVSVSFSVYFGLRNNKRADNKELTSEIAERVTWNTKIEYKIDSINTSVTEINNTIAAIVDKVENYGAAYTYINDGSFISTNRMDQSIINFANGFNDSGEFILITAGGME